MRSGAADKRYSLRRLHDLHLRATLQSPILELEMALSQDVAKKLFSVAVSAFIASIALSRIEDVIKILDDIVDISYELRSNEGLESVFLTALHRAFNSYSDGAKVDYYFFKFFNLGTPKLLGGGYQKSYFVNTTKGEFMGIDRSIESAITSAMFEKNSFSSFRDQIYAKRAQSLDCVGGAMVFGGLGLLPDGKEVYGLRYWPAKDATPMIKYVIPSMKDLVEDAIARIKKHTESARALARWYELNPDRLYLPEHLNAFRGKNLTLEQVSEILYGAPDLEEIVSRWLLYRKLNQPLSYLRKNGIPFSVVEKFVVGSLPDCFPFLDKGMELKYSEALCVVHPYTFNQQKQVSLYGLESVTHGHMSDALGARIDHNASSIFSRLGILGSGAEAIKINTHKFRHYLNTLAMHGGLSEIDIAKWSGRKDVAL